MKIKRVLHVKLSETHWRLFDRLHYLVQQRYKVLGEEIRDKPKPAPSQVAGAILEEALELAAGEINGKYEEDRLNRAHDAAIRVLGAEGAKLLGHREKY
jgi:hypothetical protein